MQYNPHEYQKFCIDYLLERPAAGLFLKPGMGKTSVALTAAERLLYDTFEASKVLVIAPLRVAEDTWSRESAKWDHLQHLRVSRVLGSIKERRAALRADADIYCINRENVDWLVKAYGMNWPFDVVIIDELSSFRNPSARRFKALRKVRPLVKYLWGLTGTPRPKSLLNLWAQVYLLDRGERLGKTFTEYKRRYFNPGRRNGYVVYEWVPCDGAEDEIYARIGDICVSLETKGNVNMPELVETIRSVVLSPGVRAMYNSMEREAVLPLAGATIDAGSAAAVNGKWLQIAGGAIYDEDHQPHELHTEKLDGENNCLSRYGVFARSHVAPTTSPWTSQLRQRWELLKNDLGDIELFGENLYAVHSIEYKRLETHFYVFAVRCLDKWLSWDEVKFYAALFDLPTVPELCTECVDGLTVASLEQHVVCLAQEPSVFGSCDAQTGLDCTREGVVTRNIGEYATADFAHNVFKYVRKGHVQTGEHWTRHWKRARLVWELKQEKGGNR